MADLEGFLRAVALEGDGQGRFSQSDRSGAVVFGGVILAQLLGAAAGAVPGQRVKSLHAVFARAASAEVPLEFAADTIHVGRSFASVNVTATQGTRRCAQGLVLLEADAPDLIRHAPTMPEEVGPPPVEAGEWWERHPVDGADLEATDVGPAEFALWSRFPGAGDDPLLAQQLLAYASDGFLIGTALRPHPGFGQAQAHHDFSTTVLTHTLSFHEPFSAEEWLLLAHEAPYAGRGRAYGRAHVFGADGRLVASFVQESMIRAFAPSG